MMINTSRPLALRRARRLAGYQQSLAGALLLGLIAVVTHIGSGDGIVLARAAQTAQAADPCALVTAEEVQDKLAPKVDVGKGVSSSSGAPGAATCRYAWGGVGVGRFELDVTVSDASRMFPGMIPDSIKQQLQKLARPETVDMVILDIGEAAVFKADSPGFAGTTAYLKGRILQVYLDGFDAQEKKDQLIALLKSAASRL